MVFAKIQKRFLIERANEFFQNVMKIKIVLEKTVTIEKYDQGQ